MLFLAGLVLLALGLLSGAYLVLAPLGLVGGTAGLALWLLFPALTIVGYLLAAVPSKAASLPALSRGAGVVLILLALLAAIGLVLDATAIVQAPSGTYSLWYVLAIGLALGAAGLGSHRRAGEA